MLESDVEGILGGMTDAWRPLDADDDDSTDYAALYDDVTEWLEPSLVQWIEVMISET